MCILKKKFSEGFSPEILNLSQNQDFNGLKTSLKFSLILYNLKVTWCYCEELLLVLATITNFQTVEDKDFKNAESAIFAKKTTLATSKHFP